MKSQLPESLNRKVKVTKRVKDKIEKYKKEGKSNSEISRLLQIHVNTIRYHFDKDFREKILKRTGDRVKKRYADNRTYYFERMRASKKYRYDLLKDSNNLKKLKK